MCIRHPIQFVILVLLLVGLFASSSASADNSETIKGTLGFQGGASITGSVTARQLKFRTDIDTLAISVAKIAGFVNQRLDLKGIGVFEGSFVEGTFLIETTQGKVERAAQDIQSIQIDPLVSLTGDHAENRIQAVQRGLPFAELSAFIYQCKDECSVLAGKAGQWTPLLDSRALFKERERALNASQASTAESTPTIRIPQSPMGFRAVAFQSTETNEIAIVYNGTDSIADWATNFAHVNPSWEPKQYSAAIDFAQEVEKRFCSGSKNCRDRVSLTGHSLGGGLAQYAAITFGRKAYTFNAAGLWDSTAGDLDTTVAAQASVVHFKSKGYKFGLPLGADFVPYTGVQFAEHTIEIPVKLPIWSWDAVTLQLVIHNMERLRDAMFTHAATQGDGVLSAPTRPDPANDPTDQVPTTAEESEDVLIRNNEMLSSSTDWMSLRYEADCQVQARQESAIPCPYREDSTCIVEGCFVSGPVELAKPITMYSEPGSSQEVYVGRTGEFLVHETSVSYSVPCPARVKHSAVTALKPGMSVYRLRDTGEGAFLYVAGDTIVESDFEDEIPLVSECPQRQEEWVRLRTESGTTGWALLDQTAVLGNSIHDPLTRKPPEWVGQAMANNGVTEQEAPSWQSADHPCSDPATELSKTEILSLVSGAAFDTREGYGRYVHKEYAEYDFSRDRGIVSGTSEYRGKMETSQRVYSVADGRLCETGLNGGPTYCEYVKRCDPEGDGVRVYLLDDQNLISTHVEIESPIKPPVPLKGLYASPLGTQWVQVASRQALEDAREVARQIGESARIFRAENGWYAITSALLNQVEYENGGLERLIASNGWPSDSLLTRGSNYVEEVAVEDSESPSPTFTRTITLRDSWVLSRSWLSDKTPFYDRISLAEAGESVIVFGEPDAQGDCLVDSHEGIFMKCADLEAFASTPSLEVAEQPALVTAAGAAAPRAGGENGPATINSGEIEVVTSDGAKLVGQIADDQASFKSSFGEIEINLRDIRAYADGKLSTADGTVLNGVFGKGKISVTTALGSLAVNGPDIVVIRQSHAGVSSADINDEAPSTSMADLVRKFQKLSEFKTDKRVIEHRFDGCTLFGFDVYLLRTDTYGFTTKITTSQWRLKSLVVDLTKVDLRKSEVEPDYNGEYNVSLVLPRGHYGMVIGPTDLRLNLHQENFKLVLDTLVETAEAAASAEAVITDHDRKTRPVITVKKEMLGENISVRYGRELVPIFIPDEFSADSREISEAFVDILRACANTSGDA